MAIKTVIDDKANLRTHTVTGELTFEEAFAELEATYSRSDFQPDMNVMWDMTGARIRSMSSADVQRLSDLAARNWGLGGKSRGALVVSRDFEFGLMRMLEILLESRMTVQIQVFRDLDEALRWVTQESRLTSQTEE